MKSLLRAALAALILLGGVSVAATPASAQVTIRLGPQPPQPREFYGRPPHPGCFWVRGHYVARYNHWVWVRGHWRCR
jgi:hypothetical protein